MYRRGFTIVELVIVISLMGILLALGVANLTSSQANGRDAKRAGDVANIALNLEAYYTSGNGSSAAIGSYPTTALIGNETTYLPNLDPQSILAPGQTTDSLVAATINTQTTAGVTPQPTISKYVYQPIAQDGSLCSSGSQTCQKFNLYYMTEVDNVVHMVVSRNQ
jgi:prepilin-type N-terminal cleavage/methylation domain-containing protein